MTITHGDGARCFCQILSTVCTTYRHLNVIVSIGLNASLGRLLTMTAGSTVAVAGSVITGGCNYSKSLL